jgi:hypothetical protein
MRVEMERTRLRGVVAYDYSYRTSTAPRTLPQIQSRALVSEMSISDGVSPPEHVKQRNLAAAFLTFSGLSPQTCT